MIKKLIAGDLSLSDTFWKFGVLGMALVIFVVRLFGSFCDQLLPPVVFLKHFLSRIVCLVRFKFQRQHEKTSFLFPIIKALYFSPLITRIQQLFCFVHSRSNLPVSIDYLNLSLTAIHKKDFTPFYKFTYTIFRMRI